MLFVGDLWVVLTHEYYKVSIHATHNQFFHLTITEESVSQGKNLISARIYALTEDPKEPLEQVDILGNHPYLVGSLSFLMKCSFTMEIICISHISYQLSLFSFFLKFVFSTSTSAGVATVTPVSCAYSQPSSCQSHESSWGSWYLLCCANAWPSELKKIFRYTKDLLRDYFKLERVKTTACLFHVGADWPWTNNASVLFEKQT